ncbi:hypothetical protein TRIUR3_00763 [Triticum urartu]|uniref:60S ribosomal protein L7a n=1 Tax=Triticum urartu TaxID=4572 RepID=M7Z1M6_TRIUA|nr:hypothetical protein TRIUR3_00763 [Triticum urartu]
MGMAEKSSATRKAGLITKTLDRCWSTPMRNKPAEGCFSVYVGAGRQRFVVRTVCVNHPLFRALLEEAEEVFGYAAAGPLELPCNAEMFAGVLEQIEEEKQMAGRRRVGDNGAAATAPKRGGKAPVPAKKKAADLHRFVKWPKVVRIQRQRRILKQRLKVPPALHQFTRTLDKNLATNLFKMLLKYRPEDKVAKKERLLKRAQAEAEGKTVEAKKPIVVKYGLNHVTYLIEQSKAQLVVIAHDVDPIELVVWLPALCRKMEIVHKKTASVLCLTTVKNEDKLEFSKILEAIKANFNDKFDEVRKKWGGGVMGSKSQAKTKARERLIAKEAAQRMN